VSIRQVSLRPPLLLLLLQLMLVLQGNFTD